MAKTSSGSAAAAGASGPNGSGSAKTANAAATAFVAEDDDAPSSALYSYAWIGVVGYLMVLIVYNAYRIRMSAIDEYGPVIHEFDPYFNYRATEVRIHSAVVFDDIAIESCCKRLHNFQY